MRRPVHCLPGIKCVLVYPPLVRTGLTGPPLGIQHLAWNLAAAGIRVKLVDLNIGFIRDLFSPDFLRRFNPKERREASLAIRLEAHADASERSEMRAAHIGPLISVLEAAGAIDGADAFAPGSMDKDPLLVASFAVEDFVQDIIRNEVKFVGFSILCSEQVRYALQIARRLRNGLGNRITLIFGGSEISGWPNEQLQQLEDRNEVDLVVVGDGEAALLDIVNREPASVRGIVRGTRTRLVDVPIAASFQIPLDNYFEPRAWNVVESSGCYWNRCTHCDYIALHDALDFGRDLSLLVDGMSSQAQTSGVKHFHLINETIAPARARKLAEAVRARGADIKWSSFVKIDRRFTKELVAACVTGGCDFMVVGVESLSDPELITLQKGYTADEAVCWLRTALDAGARVVINLIVGIPGSTSSGDKATLHKLEDRLPELVGSVKLYRFVLTELSLMGRAPADFGMEPLRERYGERGHRGGSSIAYSAPSDLDSREEDFRRDLSRMHLQRKLQGPLGRVLLELHSNIAGNHKLSLGAGVKTGPVNAADGVVYNALTGASFSTPMSLIRKIQQSSDPLASTIDLKALFQSTAIVEWSTVVELLHELALDGALTLSSAERS